MKDDILNNAKEANWYLIYCGNADRGAKQISSLLKRLGYSGTPWVPANNVIVTKNGQTKPSSATLFPSYVFLKIAMHDNTIEQGLLEAKIGKFLKNPGDDNPAVIPLENIDHIWSLIKNGAAPAEEEIQINVEKGNLVEICMGAFAGFKGIVKQVKGQEVTIETLMFGRGVLVCINATSLSKLLDKYEDNNKLS